MTEMNAVRPELEFTIEGHKLAARCFNEDKAGTPIVFIHGLTTSLNFWSFVQVPMIQESVRWYSLSMPGHYPAVFPAGFREQDLTMDMLTRILAAAIHELTGDQPVILAGHSLGGSAALSITSSEPGLVKGVVCISGFIHGALRGLSGVLQWMARSGKVSETLLKLDLKLLASSRCVFKYGISVFAHDWKALYSHPSIDRAIDLLYPDTKNLDVNAMAAFCRRLPDMDISEGLPRITAPTLLITGTRDWIVQPEHSHMIKEKVRASELVALEGAGHLPMIERAHQYRRAVTGWLEKIVS